MVEPRPFDRSWPLRGRDLRYAAMAVLLRRGTVSVSDILADIEREGFRVSSSNQAPNKALSDALRHEVARGRVIRAARGTYAIGKLSSTTAWRIRTRWVNASR